MSLDAGLLFIKVAWHTIITFCNAHVFYAALFKKMSILFRAGLLFNFALVLYFNTYFASDWVEDPHPETHSVIAISLTSLDVGENLDR
jgi:hypothetical protein